ncbi:MAG TPA: bifunctional UDP-N-acetylglucosamine diphosphorylase/glucosamine-1-phosphate N-acetyltransferase GlmU [Bryobacteraceae bacterium]|jgi:bifunctional UDP-N-acetylglucosamine pyrophosphorylase/glucosamine-1-phosphate N-acetyltransferase|nr:bifunctional UDP-N-acetylglucosamine diphosphorylase/glucosamine-1-phosphate N-acetyltransferase GlmU [Bryobacteraceae bacterium]
MKQDLTVIILAAGQGTRMKSKKAKVLHEAGGDTILNHVIRAALTVADASRVIAVIGHQADRVRESVTEPIEFALQSEQKGSGHAVLCAQPFVEPGAEVVMVLNGDGPLIRPDTLRALADAVLKGSKGAVVTTELDDPAGYGRIVRNQQGGIEAIVEERSASAEIRRIREINTGVYCFRSVLWDYLKQIQPTNAAGEYYVTDVAGLMTRNGDAVSPLLVKDSTELLGINTLVELAVADGVLRQRKAQELMLSGVTIENPASVTIDAAVRVAPDTVIEANVQLRGKTRVGEDCHIGTGSVLRNCVVEDNVRILPYVVAEASHMGANACVGPFSRLRMNAHAGAGTHIGNFVELKKTTLGAGSKANHLAYLGDATIGSGVNIGAGSITCNYDGAKKHQTHIEDGVFVGSNSTLVAPLTIHKGSYVAAGSVITKEVEADALAIGRSRQSEKSGWAKRRRELKQVEK